MSIYDVFGGSKPFNKEEWAAQKQAQRKEAYELIDNTCAEMLSDGDAFQQYLEVQGRFDRYSVNNAILVSAQMPEATSLKDKNACYQRETAPKFQPCPSVSYQSNPRTQPEARRSKRENRRAYG